MILKTKKCSKCKKNKPIEKFYKNKSRKDGFSYQCKECDDGRFKNNPRQAKLKRIRFIKNNPEYYSEYRKNNRSKIKEYNKKHYKNNTEERLRINLMWAKNNPEKVKLISRRTMKKRYCIPKFMLSRRVSTRIYKSLKVNKKGKHWESLVGYNLYDLMAHLENQFKDNMNWQNMGKWHIDHIIPISLWKFNSYPLLS